MKTPFSLEGGVSGTILVLDAEPVVSFAVTGYSKIGYNFAMLFTTEQFLDLLHSNHIEECSEAKVLLDYYVEDEDGNTCCETYAVSIVDYLMNYVSNEKIATIIRISVENFLNQIK
jgi:hypothetical protein